jgi:hypothetical protein
MDKRVANRTAVVIYIFRVKHVEKINIFQTIRPPKSQKRRESPNEKKKIQPIFGVIFLKARTGQFDRRNSAAKIANFPNQVQIPDKYVFAEFLVVKFWLGFGLNMPCKKN